MMKGRKGQYLAIETVLALGISIIAATAIIIMFDSYSDTVMDSIHERHATEIESEVLNAIYNLQDADTGSSISVEIPQLPGATEYDLTFEDRELIINVEDKEFKQEINSVRWASDFQGSVSTSEVQVTKLEDGIHLRPD